MVEKWSDVVYSLEAESAVLTDDVDVKCQRSRGRVDESETWTLLSICWGIGEENAQGREGKTLRAGAASQSPRGRLQQGRSTRALQRPYCFLDSLLTNLRTTRTCLPGSDDLLPGQEEGGQSCTRIPSLSLHPYPFSPVGHSHPGSCPVVWDLC